MPFEVNIFLMSLSVPYQLKPGVSWPIRGRCTEAGNVNQIKRYKLSYHRSVPLCKAPLKLIVFLFLEVIWHWTYGKRPLSERGNHLLTLHGLLFFQLAARVLLYAPSHRQYETYHSLCYTSCGELAGTRKRSWGIDPMTHCNMSGCSTTELYLTPVSLTMQSTPFC